MKFFGLFLWEKVRREKDFERNFEKSFEIKDDDSTQIFLLFFFFSKKKTREKKKKKRKMYSQFVGKTNIFVDTTKQESKKGDTELKKEEWKRKPERSVFLLKKNARNHFSEDRKKTKHCTNKCQKCSTKKRKQTKHFFGG